MEKRHDTGFPAGMRGCQWFGISEQLFLCLDAFRFETEQRDKSLQLRTCKVGVRERSSKSSTVRIMRKISLIL